MWFASGWQAHASLCTPDPDLTLGPGRSHFSNSILGRSHPKGFQPSKYLTCIVTCFFFFNHSNLKESKFTLSFSSSKIAGRGGSMVSQEIVQVVITCIHTGSG